MHVRFALPGQLFAGTPHSLRRLVLVLYALVGPPFLLLMLVLGAGPDALLAVALLILAGAALILARAAPTNRDWIFTVAFAPTACCGLAYAATGAPGVAFLTVLGAPMAWAAVLLETPVVVSAWIVAAGTCFLAVYARQGLAVAVPSTLLCGVIGGLVAWVIHGMASRLRLLRAQDRALIEAVPDTLARADRSGRFLELRAPPGDALPTSAQALVGRPVAELVSGELAGRMTEAIERAVATGQVQTVEYGARYGEDERYFESRFARAGPDEVLVIRRDITERRRAEAEHRLLSALIAEMQDSVLVTDPEFRIVRWSGASTRIYGWTAEEAIGRVAPELFRPERTEEDLPGLLAKLHAGQSVTFQGYDLRKDGSRVRTVVDITPLRGADGAVTGFLAVARDVSRQVEAERALRESEERYRSVVAATGEGIVMREPDGRISACNPAAERLLGLTPAQLSAQAYPDGWYTVREDGSVLPPGERPNRVASRTGRPVTNFVMGARKPDGTVTWMSVNSEPIVRPGEPPPYAVVAAYRDITLEREQAEEVRRSREKLALAVDSSGLGIWDWDLRTGRVGYGPQWPALLGLGPGEVAPDIVAWAQLVHPEDTPRVRDQVIAHLKGLVPALDVEYRMRARDGSWRWIHSRGRVAERDGAGKPVRLAGTHADVTRMHELQEKLVAAARLASVGTLAAGVAHEINNPLAFVSANVTFALELIAAADAEAQPRLVEQLREVLGELRLGTERITAIVKAMRTLGRPDHPAQPWDIDVRAEILGALQLVRNQVLQRARLEVDVPETLPLARGNTTELGRVFVNLLDNAAQAIPEGRAGAHRVSIRARAEDGEVRVDVSDTGEGMSPAVQARIFEPFFTTKPVGQGSGLGLSIARSIIESAGGRIEVESAVGRGTTFRVWLRAATAAAER